MPLIRVSRKAFKSKSAWFWCLYPSPMPWVSVSWSSIPVLEWPVKNIRSDYSHLKGQVQLGVLIVFKHLNPKKPKCVAWMKFSTLRMMIKSNCRQEWEKCKKKKKKCALHLCTTLLLRGGTEYRRSQLKAIDCFWGSKLSINSHKDKCTSWPKTPISTSSLHILDFVQIWRISCFHSRFTFVSP